MDNNLKPDCAHKPVKRATLQVINRKRDTKPARPVVKWETVNVKIKPSKPTPSMRTKRSEDINIRQRSKALDTKPRLVSSETLEQRQAITAEAERLADLGYQVMNKIFKMRVRDNTDTEYIKRKNELMSKNNLSSNEADQELEQKFRKQNTEIKNIDIGGLALLPTINAVKNIIKTANDDKDDEIKIDDKDYANLLANIFKSIDDRGGKIFRMDELTGLVDLMENNPNLKSSIDTMSSSTPNVKILSSITEYLENKDVIPLVSVLNYVNSIIDPDIIDDDDNNDITIDILSDNDDDDDLEKGITEQKSDIATRKDELQNWASSLQYNEDDEDDEPEDEKEEQEKIDIAPQQEIKEDDVEYLIDLLLKKDIKDYTLQQVKDLIPPFNKMVGPSDLYKILKVNEIKAKNKKGTLERMKNNLISWKATKDVPQSKSGALEELQGNIRDKIIEDVNLNVSKKVKPAALKIVNDTPAFDTYNVKSFLIDIDGLLNKLFTKNTYHERTLRAISPLIINKYLDKGLITLAEAQKLRGVNENINLSSMKEPEKILKLNENLEKIDELTATRGSGKRKRMKKEPKKAKEEKPKTDTSSAPKRMKKEPKTKKEPKPKQKRKESAWIALVKSISKDKQIKYGEALKIASAQRKKL